MQLRFIREGPWPGLFQDLLAELLALTGRAAGVLGEILEPGTGGPRLQLLAGTLNQEPTTLIPLPSLQVEGLAHYCPRSELHEVLAARLGPAANAGASLVPLLVGGHVRALLALADGGENDAAGRFTRVSLSVRRVLGYQPQELLGRPCHDLIHPEDFVWMRTDVRHDGGVATGECRLAAKDGQWVWCEYLSVPIFGCRISAGPTALMQSCLRCSSSKRVNSDILEVAL
ncbi:MAG: aryl hydrocarbon receptor nuclear translocator isoform [Hydrocarboniphaga sp.]|uniref:PAS domain-containing protein n=1 Tax=Hydrocarboniphaga sp. TaxID=2033016 RepID=UPI00262462C4|nr:PAS domain-containing protein [Hydrocarboniphaga sp.]MDB5973098.1 aryl hydrocarbon receptor nuclear translocator isoform [Hydrocarboniphaga sp.]